METITIMNAKVKRSGARMTITGKVSVDDIDFGTAPDGYSAQATDKKTGQVYLLT